MTQGFGESAGHDEDSLRQWIADYLVASLGCSRDQVELGASMHDLGVGSRDAVVLTGRLSEVLDRPVSPVEFWQYPTVAALARFLTGGEVEPVDVGGPGSPRATGRDPIAVIGVGCRFPGGVTDLDGLADFLAAGGSGVREVPQDRWSGLTDGSPDEAAVLAATTRWGGYLDGLAEFDADFFEIPAGEADKMDPQQRLLLEVTSEALDHAGIPADALAETRTGVFAGACSAEYWPIATADLTAVDAWSGTGGALSIIANRLSYFFDLRGPSVTVDTACSSSLVAVHLACQSLRAGESDVALAGGVNVLLSPAPTRSFDVAEVLSRSGGCHAFDADADGFVRSEGAGVVVLKRLADAVRDGDRVLAVVRGSAVNQDGRSNGLMAPNPAAQMAVLRAAYADAGVDPRDVGYVEAHGTGTLLGDPIEARALGTVLGKGRPADEPLLIGSVKSNLGHLEAAAGIAGLAKAVLAVNRGVVPANLDYRNPNPHIPFQKLRLKVVAEKTDWADRGRPRIAGVSSFGFGGTNAHVVLEQPPVQPAGPAQPDSAPVTTLVVSGRTPARIAAAAGSIADWMAGAGAGVGLDQVAHTLNHHRSRYPVFATVCARDRAQAAEGLAALAAGRTAPGVVDAHAGRCRPGTVFVYSGQGSQWVGMGRRLLADEPAFAAAVDDLEPAFAQQVGFSLRHVLADAEEVRGDARVQPVVMGLQLALTALWRSYGVHPDAVIGHSMGEVSAAVVAGALTAEQGFAVIAARSRLMSGLAGQGAVALLEADATATETLIADYPGVEIAGYLSPRQTVVAGPVAAIGALIAAVTAANRFARRVNMEVASHTALMDPVCEPLRAELAALTPRVPLVRMFSTVTGPAGAPVLDADYWVANVRQPVRFEQAVSAAGADHGTFIEISPNPILTHSIDDTLGDVHHHALGTLLRDADDTLSFHTSLNATHTTHPPVTPHPPGPHTPLPTTPWQHNTHWVPVRPPRLAGDHAVSHRPVASVVPNEWVCTVAWPVSPTAADRADGGDQTWLVIADSAIGAELGRRLGDAAVTVVDPDELADDPDAVIAELAGVTHVLYAPEGVTPAAEAWNPLRAKQIFATARTLAAAMADRPLPPDLTLLTRNAAPIEAGDRANPAHAVLWGLGRTLALEHPEIWGRVIDVDESVPAEISANWVLDEAAADPEQSEDQVVYRAGMRRVPRLRRTRLPADAVRLDPATSHLVVGATGNIGPHLIGYLADQGATTIVAVSRNPGTRLDPLTETLAARGVRLFTVAADAADETALAALFDRFGADLPPLSGIYLAAFGGGPATLRDMTDADVTAMFGPKLDAAWLLHRLSARQPVRQFVLFTSISGLLGSRWLGHYAATTTFLDTFAYARRAAGLPATAVDWGWWKSLADNQSEAERQVTLESGLLPMSDDAIRALSVLTAPQAPVCCSVVAADWDRLAGAYRTRASLRIVDELLAAQRGTAEDGSETTEFRSALQACDPSRRRQLLTDTVCGMVARAMGLASPGELDRSAGFFQSGMNSLTSVALRRSLGEALGEELPASVVFDYPSVDELVGYLAAKLPETAAVVETTTEDDYGDLAEDELLQKLSERLG